jgi:hypothetical protein
MDYAHAFRYSSETAAAAAAGDDVIFGNERLWIAAAEWSSAFGHSLLQHQHQHQHDHQHQQHSGGVMSQLPVWMIEVIPSFDTNTVLARIFALSV